MKGILPVPCRVAGYALLLLSVFVPMLMYMFGMVHDGNLVFVKLGMKLVIWISLFMVFLAKTKDENEETGKLRLNSMKYRGKRTAVSNMAERGEGTDFCRS